jgi:hypothetical protein
MQGNKKLETGLVGAKYKSTPSQIQAARVQYFYLFKQAFGFIIQKCHLLLVLLLVAQLLSTSEFCPCLQFNPSLFLKIRPVWGCLAPFLRAICRALCADGKVKKCGICLF